MADIKTVFVSSTAKDLAEYRKAVIEAINGMDGFKADAMENWGAREDCAEQFCPDRVRRCDVFVGLVGHCYGSRPHGSEISFTEAEYDAATDLPKLMFVCPDDFASPSDVLMDDVLANGARQREFRRRVQSREQTASFNSPDALKQAVTKALLQPRTARQSRHSEGDAPSESDAFVRAYRQRFVAFGDMLDLRHVGATQAGGTGRPVRGRLDDVYVPLRFHLSGRLRRSATVPLTPTDLLRCSQPVVIRGAPGAGKTTWMRYTFRRLLERRDSLPLMIELRRLAADWEQNRGISLDQHLVDVCASHACPVGVAAFVSDPPDDVRPVLLVDGWDELGEFGATFRERLLGFLNSHDRVLAVVTSRPYGQGRPSHSDGFLEVDVAPLADGDVSLLAERFFSHCYLDEGDRSSDALHSFLVALDRSPEARDLARTPLLLTMMLLISRSAPLPDKRHLLYDRCLENLLTALPQRREEEGAKLYQEQWRPQDSEERRRVTAALASAVQTDGYTNGRRQPIVGTYDSWQAKLPESWPEGRRRGFLAWLAGASGVLTDRADGSVQFTHLSFQEYLTAWHLNADVEGDEARRQQFFGRATDESWWETLRLWAAILNGTSPSRLSAVLERLVEGHTVTHWLAGAVFADGLGSDEDFSLWCRGLLDAVRNTDRGGWRYAGAAWRASLQATRRTALAKILNDTARPAEWVSWMRLEDLSIACGLGAMPPPNRSSAAATVSVLKKAQRPTERTYAWTRHIAGCHPLWPFAPTSLAMIRLWPSRRAVDGCRAQAMVSLGLGPQLWPSRDAADSGSVRLFAAALSATTGKLLALDVARHLGAVLDSGRMRPFETSVVRSVPADWALYWTQHWPRSWAELLDGGLPECWEQRLFRPPRVEGDAKLLALLATVETWSVGRASPRALLADKLLDRHLGPLTSLMRGAALLSFETQVVEPASFDTALTQYLSTPDADPLWPALARHISRRSTDEDRALLIDLAQHPEKREPPLRWGLQYWVRGDIMLDDGTVVPLDKYYEDAGLAPPPLLEEMEPELEIDWDADDGQA